MVLKSLKYVKKTLPPTITPPPACTVDTRQDGSMDSCCFALNSDPVSTC
uniref:Uncharacterized protein n=1 Tax=Anguilla anguilla TaxID=7936 RepID=A0A0E9QDQ5_ANGAN